MIQRLPLFFIMTLFCVSLHGAMLNGMAIRAGSRGLAFVLESDEPLIESHTVSKAGKNNTLAIILKNTVYGLDNFSFSTFPEQSRVKKIVVTEKTNGSICLTLTIAMDLNKPVHVKSVGSRTLFLVATTPCAEYAWTTTDAIAAPSAPSRKGEENGADAALHEKSSPAVVRDIRYLKRGAIDQLTITTDKPAHIQTQKKDNTIVAVFIGAVCGLPEKEYQLPQQSLFASLTVKESVRNGIPRVGIILVGKSSLPHSFVQILPRQCVFYATPPEGVAISGLAYWTHAGQDNYSVSFSGDASENTTAAASYNPIPAVTRRSLERMVVVRDKVNFRSEPSTETNDNLISTLRAGTKGTLLKKQGQWLYIKVDGDNTEGWVYENMMLDSAAVSSAQWDRFAPTPEPPPPVAGNISTPAMTGNDSRPTQEAVISDMQSSQDSGAAPATEKSKRVVAYHANGRDPFLPLNLADFLKSELVKVEQSRLVGILYSASDRIALVEDAAKGMTTFTLRENDAITNGRVLKIKPDEVVFLLNDAGFSRTFSLKLNPKEE